VAIPNDVESELFTTLVGRYLPLIQVVFINSHNDIGVCVQ